MKTLQTALQQHLITVLGARLVDCTFTSKESRSDGIASHGIVIWARGESFGLHSFTLLEPVGGAAVRAEIYWGHYDMDLGEAHSMLFQKMGGAA